MRRATSGSERTQPAVKALVVALEGAEVIGRRRPSLTPLQAAAAAQPERLWAERPQNTWYWQM